MKLDIIVSRGTFRFLILCFKRQHCDSFTIECKFSFNPTQWNCKYFFYVSYLVALSVNLNKTDCYRHWYLVSKCHTISENCVQLSLVIMSWNFNVFFSINLFRSTWMWWKSTGSTIEQTVNCKFFLLET